jgi:hypothetical protein
MEGGKVTGIDVELSAFADLATPIREIQRPVLDRHRHDAVPALFRERHDDFRSVRPPPRRRDIRLLLPRLRI